MSRVYCENKSSPCLKLSQNEIVMDSKREGNRAFVSHSSLALMTSILSSVVTKWMVICILFNDIFYLSPHVCKLSIQNALHAGPEYSKTYVTRKIATLYDSNSFCESLS